MKFIATLSCIALLSGMVSCSDPNGTDSFKNSMKDRRDKPSDDNDRSGSDEMYQETPAGDTITE